MGQPDHDRIARARQAAARTMTLPDFNLADMTQVLLTFADQEISRALSTGFTPAPEQPFTERRAQPERRADPAAPSREMYETMMTRIDEIHAALENLGGRKSA